MKIWIGGKLGVRDWIDVVLAVNSLTIMGATLPLPDILAGGELAVTNQVGAAITLMIKLTGTLIENELEELIVIGKVVSPYISITCTLAEEIDPIDGSLLAGSDDLRISGISLSLDRKSTRLNSSHV